MDGTVVENKSFIVVCPSKNWVGLSSEVQNSCQSGVIGLCFLLHKNLTQATSLC